MHNNETNDNLLKHENMFKTLLVSINSKFIHSNLALKYIKSFYEKQSKLLRDLEQRKNKKIGAKQKLYGNSNQLTSNTYNKEDENKYNIDIKEFTINQKIEYITDEIINTGAKLICFSCYIWNIEYIKEIIYILKTSDPDFKILLGGPEVSYEIEKTMKENELIDFIIYGEGEISFHEFLHSINENKPFNTVAGLAYRDENKVIVNKPREINNNLDELASPYMDGEKYYDKIIYYESSRGCPFRCAFCMSSIDKTVRFFSLDRVKSDLMILLNTGARQIKFVDRTFNSDYKRAMKIMQFIAENNKNQMTIHFEITADIINDEFLNFLKTMPVNMFQLEIGVQSINLDTLEAINRKTDIGKLIYVIENIKANKNMHMHLDLIAGLPYENYDTFKNSFNIIHNLYADKLQLGFLKVLKGTKIYNDKNIHDVKYNKKAPYEIIKNKYISYEQLLKLKNIEELVERYYNERYFDATIKYISENFYENKPFDFYEEFSYYWRSNDLYMSMHSRKKLYEIIYNFAKYKEILNDTLLNNLLYDFVSCNEKEELISIFDKNMEDDLREIKRLLAKNEQFRKEYLKIKDSSYKAINDFRLVKIGKDTILFVYKNKTNVFERCTTYKVNELLYQILENRKEEN